MKAWIGPGSGSVRSRQTGTAAGGCEVGKQGNLGGGERTEALRKNLPESLPCPPAMPGRGRMAVAVRCCKFPGAHHFYQQGRPTVPLGSLPLGPTSLPRTFRPGFPTQAGLSYLQPSGKAEQPEGTQGFRLKLLFS